MATKAEFAAFILEQFGGEKRGVTCRKMFGEYGLHCAGMFFAMICDGLLYLKPTPAGEALLRARGALVYAPPYPGAKDYLCVEDPDDGRFLRELMDTTICALPQPKPKGKRARRNGAPEGAPKA